MQVFGLGLCILLIGSQGLGDQVALAGNLEPPGPPSPTMKTLEQTSGAWDQVLPAAERFVLVMGGAAVLDKETNLVWEQSPSTFMGDWLNARFGCMSRTVGGRKGWRLPSVHELNSLVDPGNPGGNPDLPAGHPFSNVQSSRYWSATRNVDNPTFVYFVPFFDGGEISSISPMNLFPVWCVRGDMNEGQY